MRLLDMSTGVYTLDHLGMSQEDSAKLRSVLSKPYGMILSTGPTGSGKSTSLYSILKEINRSDINIITLEDPVEYRMPKIRQIQLNTKAGMTFASGLRSILRQDPDVMMVGEIRDAETAGIATQAVLTGHRLLSTVHTNDAAGAVTRLIDMEIEPFLIASVLLVSFAQRLVRVNCPYCKNHTNRRKKLCPRGDLTKWKAPIFSGARVVLNACRVPGRTGVFEILIIDEMIRQLILDGKNSSGNYDDGKGSGYIADT